MDSANTKSHLSDRQSQGTQQVGPLLPHSAAQHAALTLLHGQQQVGTEHRVTKRHCLILVQEQHVPDNSIKQKINGQQHVGTKHRVVK